MSTDRRAGRHAAPRPQRRPRLGRRTGRRPTIHVIRLLAGQLAAVRGLAALLALVTMGSIAFLTITPVVQAHAEDRAVGDLLRDAPNLQRDITLRLAAAPLPPNEPTGPVRAGDEDPFAPVDEAMRTALTPAVTRLLGEQSYAVTSPSMLVAARRGTPLTVEHQQMVVRMETPLASKVSWTAGQAPTAPAEQTSVEVSEPQSGGVTQVSVMVIPVALRDTTAKAYGLGVNDVVELTPIAPGPGTLVVRVTGLFAPIDARDRLWDTDPRMLGIAKVPGEQGAIIDEAAMLAAPSAYGGISDSLFREPIRGGSAWRSFAMVHEWRYPLDPDRLGRDDVRPLREALVRVQSDPRSFSGLPEAPTVTSGLGNLLTTYESQVAGARAMTSFAFAGFTMVALLVLFLAAVVGAERRMPQLQLMRARGGSLVTLLPVATAGAAWPAVVGAVLVLAGVAAFARSTPDPAAIVAALLIVLGPMAVVALVTRRRLLSADSASTPTGRRQRLVAEVGVVVLAALAVTTVRSRGTEIASGTTDWYAALTPFLVAAAGAVVGIRALSWLLRVAAGWAARRRGLVAHLGLTRAARTGSTALVPLAALVVGTTLVTMLGAISADISSLRQTAAYQVVGADVRVDGPQLGDATEQALARVPGVKGTTLAYVLPRASMSNAGGTTTVEILAVDPQTYAALLRDRPINYVPPPRAGSTSSTTPLPVLLSDPSATGRVQLSVRGSFVDAQVVGVDPALGRLVSGRATAVALVPLDQLSGQVPVVAPNTVFVRSDDPGAVLAIQDRDPAAFGALVTEVQSAAGVRDGVARRALSSLVTQSYVVGAGLTAITTVLAVLLLLTVTRAERTRLVVRLRTMGLPRGGERRLAWVEVMPLVVVAVVLGVAIGMIAPTIMMAALDLAPYTGAAPHPALTPRWSVGLLTGALVLVLAASALVVDSLIARRSALAENIRRGDSA